MYQKSILSQPPITRVGSPVPQVFKVIPFHWCGYQYGIWVDSVMFHFYLRAPLCVCICVRATMTFHSISYLSSLSISKLIIKQWFEVFGFLFLSNQNPDWKVICRLWCSLTVFGIWHPCLCVQPWWLSLLSTLPRCSRLRRSQVVFWREIHQKKDD